MDIPEEEQLWKAACQKIAAITGVTGFLGSTRMTRPSPIATDDVLRVLTKMGEIKSAEVKPTVRINFSIGDHVTVVDGPFKDFKGVVEEINQEKGTIRVKVEIFGRATPVELSFTQAERT
jgi:transcriptional antiterminator NusG